MSEVKGDSRVTEVQEWLNETYGEQSWFTKLTVDGMTGAGTCKALCRALQYEIGVKNVDGVIGTGTLAVLHGLPYCQVKEKLQGRQKRVIHLPY